MSARATVGVRDLFLPAGFPLKVRQTTAHTAAARFYRKHLRQNHQEPSIVEQIARAPSPFAVEGLVDDFHRFIARQTSAKLRAQVERTAHARICELRGVLP